MRIIKFIRPETIPVIGLVFSFAFWIIDSLVCTYIFEHTNFLLESLLGPTTFELWIRILVIALLMTFSFSLMVVYRKQIEAANELEKYQHHLENIVSERTRDLEDKNEQLHVEIAERQKAEAKLEYLATIDSLTSIFNRRKFNEILSYEIKRNERHGKGLSLILCDLDDFKRINDSYGHSAGDDVLVSFSQMMAGAVRKSDIFARWGGEEFILLLPETSLETAIRLAGKFRLMTDTTMIPNIGRLTASFGVAQHYPGESKEDLIKRADHALYKAKELGRNRVEISHISPVENQASRTGPVKVELKSR